MNDRDTILTFVRQAICHVAMKDAPEGFELHHLGVIDGLEQVEEFIIQMNSDD